MTTVKFKGLECEASIDGKNIVLYCIEEGKAQEFILLNAGYLLERKAQDSVSYQDIDEDGSYWTWDESQVSEYIEDHMGEFIDSFTGEVSEVPNVGLANVSSRSLIDKHQMCIEILEGIMYFEQRKKRRIESIEGFAGTFPELRRKYVNDIDTINRCIKRLEQRYKSVLESTEHNI